MTRLTPLVLLAAAACTADAKTSALDPAIDVVSEGTRVEVAVVRPSPAELSLTYSGEVEGSRDANLSSALGGYVESVSVEAGDSVQAGQVLLTVDREVYAAAVAQAKAQRDLAKEEYGRLERMGNAVSPSQLGQARTQLTVAEAGLQQAEVRLRRSSVVAPFDGVISRIGVSKGEVTGPGAPVARLVQMDPVNVLISVADQDVVTLQAGMEVTVTAPAVGQQLMGKVAHISPIGNRETRSFDVEVEVPNADGRLMPGMVARVGAKRSVGEAIVVPQDWVISHTEDRGVFVDDGGVARWRPVELGQVLRNQVVVSSGLNAGDRVVMVGHRELLDGDRLIVGRETVCCDNGRVYVAEAAP
jgi:RND family efflux transporter MFP subunit